MCFNSGDTSGLNETPSAHQYLLIPSKLLEAELEPIVSFPTPT